MARMYPASIDGDEGVSGGERVIFEFLKRAAKPQEDYVCWYNPSAEPQGRGQLVLLGRRLGVLVIVVCDWMVSQIVSATPFRFTVRAGGRLVTEDNPDREARAQAEALRERMEHSKAFKRSGADEAGWTEIPMGQLVCFPNIRRQEYRERGIQWLIPLDRVLLREDVETGSALLADRSGKAFHERMAGVFSCPTKELAPEQAKALGSLIWSERRIRIPQRQGKPEQRAPKGPWRVLDESQTRLALHLGPGHHLIKGPPGSGKTLVLVHRCCHLYKTRPDIKRILLVCYNIALVGYLKRLVKERGIGSGSTGIHIYHFFELCSHILGEEVHYENEELRYYDGITKRSLDRIETGKGAREIFDALFIDEGQDFSDDMLRAMLGVLKAGGEMTIAIDPSQDVYRRRASWRSLGIQANGRTHILKRTYRNTDEILRFGQCVLGEKAECGQQLSLLADPEAGRGTPPVLHRCEHLDEMCTYLAADIKRRVARDGYGRSDIAVIYDDKIYGSETFAYDNRALPMQVFKKLSDVGIPTAWVSQDAKAKEAYEVTDDHVSLISIHSAKGLDFGLVYLLGMDHLNPTKKTEKGVLSLMYVAVTRARHRLVIPYVRESLCIERMRNCLETGREGSS